MKLKKNTLALSGVFYTLSVLCQCNSTSGHEKANTTRLTTVELHAYLAKLHFPEDSGSFGKKSKVTTPSSHYDWGVRAELTERSD